MSSAAKFSSSPANEPALRSRVDRIVKGGRRSLLEPWQPLAWCRKPPRAPVGLASLITVAVATASCAGTTTSNDVTLQQGSGANAATRFCEVLEGHTAEMEAAAAQASASGSPIGGIIIGFTNMGRFQRMLEDLADIAPSEIANDTRIAADAIAEQIDNMGDSASDPVGAIVSSLVTSATSSPSFEAVDRFSLEHCGLVIFGTIAPTTSAGAATTSDLGDVLVVAGCDAGMASLTFIDPTSGSVVEQRSFGRSARPARLCGSIRWAAPEVAQMFSSDFRYAAATLPTSDGSERVGVIDTRTDQFTDITSLHEESGFSASTPRDRYPGFAPGGSTLRFYDGNAREFRESGEADGWMPRPWQPAGGQIGEVGVSYTSGGYIVNIEIFSVSAVAEPGGMSLVSSEHLRVAGGEERVNLQRETECTPTAWISGNEIACLVHDDGDPAVMTLNDSCTGYAVRTLVSAPERSNFYLTPSPDRTMAAFMSIKAGQVDLWTVPLSGGEPQLLTNAGSATHLGGFLSGGDAPRSTLIAWLDDGHRAFGEPLTCAGS